MTTKVKSKEQSEQPAAGPLDIEIVGFGPRDLRATYEPGLNVLAGKNGSGKSNNIGGLMWALGNDVAPKLRRGAEEAYVKINGQVIRSLPKPLKQTEDLELTLSDLSPITEIILPHVRDIKTADQHRIKNLLKIKPVDVSDEVLCMLVGDDEDALDYVERMEPEIRKKSIIEASEIVARRVHELKRSFLKRYDEAEALRLVNQAVKPERVVEVGVEEARAAEQEAVRRHERLSGEWAQRQKTEQLHGEIEATLGERPNVETAKSALQELQAANEEKRALCVELDAQIRELQVKLDAARAEGKTLLSRIRQAEEALERVGDDAVNWDRRQATLAEPITGATAADVEKAALTLQTAQETLEAARATAEYQERLKASDAARAERDAASLVADRLEKVATGVSGRLSEVLAGAGLPDWSFDGGRVYYRGELFTDLSLGQRADAVLAIRPAKPAPYNLEYVPWEFYAALAVDQEGRDLKQEFADALKRSGRIGLVEAPDAGEMRVEQV